MNDREGWGHARVSALASLLCSSHLLSHILIKLSVENSVTLNGAVMGTSRILLRCSEEFHALLSPFSA